MHRAGDAIADEIRQVWDGAVEPVPDDLLPATLSPAAREFMTTVGLPTVPTLYTTFIIDGRLSTPVSLEGREYVVFAEDEVVKPFAVELASGQVFQLAPSPSRALGRRFLNSDIALFLYFYGILHRDVLRFIEAQGELTEPQFGSILDTLDNIEAGLRRWDPSAIDGKTAWWWLLYDLREDVDATLTEMGTRPVDGE